MYISYNFPNEKNPEGIGACYHKIITFYCIAKKNNLKYIHIPTNIGHNYNNDIEWNNKWDNFFNFKKICYNNEIDINNIEKEFKTENLNIVNNNNNINKLYLYPYKYYFEFDLNPDYYFKDIQNDIIEAYNENNNKRKLIYNKNKINIAIHIRVHNDFDNEGEYELFLEGKNIRYYFNCEMYENLIKKLKEKYKNSDIHIFSQEKYFDLKYKKLREIENINIHFDNLDIFDTFHHLCNADVLVIGLSSFSFIAAFYNKNRVIYLPYITSPTLKSWIVYKDELEL